LNYFAHGTVIWLRYTGVLNSTTRLLQADRCDNNVQESETDRQTDLPDV